eukprot:snap_masked-scaffold_15-processed-gene-10.34-mRNA-1 protein AED:1.00 eAED:1.00 QI:0/0/0/0/1/1/2/0/61
MRGYIEAHDRTLDFINITIKNQYSKSKIYTVWFGKILHVGILGKYRVQEKVCPKCLVWLQV